MISEIKNNETKICKKCGRELPLSKYSKIYGKAWSVTCKDCIIDTRTKKYYENGLTLYNTDKSMRTKRNYKTKKRLEEDLGDLTDYEKVTTYNVLRVK